MARPTAKAAVSTAHVAVSAARTQPAPYARETDPKGEDRPIGSPFAFRKDTRIAKGKLPETMAAIPSAQTIAREPETPASTTSSWSAKQDNPRTPITRSGSVPSANTTSAALRVEVHARPADDSGERSRLVSRAACAAPIADTSQKAGPPSQTTASTIVTPRSEVATLAASKIRLERHRIVVGAGHKTKGRAEVAPYRSQANRSR